MPFRLELSRENLIEHIKVQLGYPTLCVELDDAHLNDAAFETELWIATHFGAIRRTNISLVSGQGEYSLPDDCETIADIAFPEYSNGAFALPVSLDGFDSLYFSGMMSQSARTGGMLSDFTQKMQYLDMIPRVLGSNQEASWEVCDRKLLVTPNTISGQAIVWYLSNQVDYDRLSLKQKFLMRKYAVAQAMLILGQIRSKYSEVPGSGSKVTLNGDALISSAETMMTELDEKMGKLVPPASFFTG